MRTIVERIKEQFTFIYKHWKGVRTKFVPLFLMLWEKHINLLMNMDLKFYNMDKFEIAEQKGRDKFESLL